MVSLSRIVLIATLLGVVWLFSGCGASATGGSKNETVTISAEDQAQAERLLDKLQKKHAVHRDREVVEIAGNLVDYYPDFAGNGEALFLAISSAGRMGDAEQVRRLTKTLIDNYPDNANVDRVILDAAEMAEAKGDTLAAVSHLITYADRHPQPNNFENPLGRADELLPSLSEADLAELMADHRGGSHWTYLGFLRIEALSAVGKAYPEAADLTAKMEARYPDDYWTIAARKSLELGARGGRGKVVVAEVNPRLVGVLAPLTGRYAVLGNAFYEAALLATRETNLNLGTAFELQLEDTGADPVTSVLAVRKLCLESGSVAILGGLLSAPTISAAVVCDFYGVPLLSPTATNASIWKVGPRVFQTNITGFYEARLLAELATTIMLKNRIAILHPDSPDGHRHAQVFTAEVESRGGEIVASAMFAPQGTDYKDQILQIRQSRPEVIFVPATVDQMVKLGPQLDFYKAGSLIMGLSNWNNQKLSERSATVLERAVFPDDLVLFERRWEHEFDRLWNPGIYPPEATAQALKAYQATRMLLETMSVSAAKTRSELAAALARRLSSQDLELAGPQSYATTVRMFSDQKIVPFPAAMFQAGWAMKEGTMASAVADSNTLDVQDPWQGVSD